MILVMAVPPPNRDHESAASLAAAADEPPSARWPRRLGPRLVVMPLLILAAAWMLQAHTAREEAARVAAIEADVRRFVGDVLGGRAVAPAVDVVPSVRSLAADAIRDAAGGRAADRLDVSVSAGDPPPVAPPGGTHTATLEADGTPRLHLRVGRAGERTVLAGWWRPVGAPTDAGSPGPGPGPGVRPSGADAAATSTPTGG